MKTRIVYAFTLLTIVCAGFFSYRAFIKKQPEKETNQEVSAQNTVTLSSGHSKNLKIEIVSVVESVFSKKVELIGETEAVPDAIIDVPARVSGRITSVHFIEGDKIKKGQILATIDSPELTKLRSNYMSAKTKHFAAEQNYERIKSLVQMNLAAKQDLIDASSILKVLYADRVSAEENLRVNGLTVSDSVSGIYHVIAPKTGLAIARNAVPGSQILGNHTLTTIADLSDLWFQGKIFESDLHLVSEEDEAKIVLNAYPDLLFSGKLKHIGEKVDPISRTIHARIVFTNKDRKAKIGLFGKAYVETNPKTGIKIPNLAIHSYQNKNFVFCKQANGSFLWKEVVLGSSIDQETEIQSGLKPGEEIVTNGSFELKSILFKSTFGEE